jgi:chorismate mutase-like protein
MMDDQEIRALLKPYRARIDDIDARLIQLLRERYDVIEEVGHLKMEKGIEPVLQYRVDEVRENAARMADEQNMDAAFIRDLWARLIKHSCDLEDKIRKGQAPASVAKAS